MKRKYFGTDGVRGKVGVAPITPDFMMHVGYAAGKVLAARNPGADRPAVLIGKDTRVSGYMLESALEAGLSAAGIDVLLVGPMPTPAVAYLTRALRLTAGIVISASHNPYDDNGIKFFSAAGAKLPDETENEIERELARPLACLSSSGLGKARRVDDAAGRYIEFCKSTFPNHLDLRGMRIALDCAHGAAYHIAPHVFHELGADVVTIGTDPDGFNINAGVGTTHPKALQQAVKRHNADLGIALDGDGDRVLMADGAGAVHDGDELLYVIARHQRAQGELKGGIVGTQMTNLGLEHALAVLGVEFARARVGDRYVLELLHERGWHLGGENSGHIVCLERHTTGDGIISALQVLRALREGGTTLDQAAAGVTLYPQVLINVKLTRRFDLRNHRALKAVIARAEQDLGTTGRVLLRESGTEPVIRVMVEGKPHARVKTLARTIADAVRAAV
ncbi:MAG TPA: phosphoglucosamine mutase [Burkholderiales bacterium]|jgi:phosphoglucosamine mutase|nr:phosphoglucosamine mutase [Burkholderiales bacterium]